MKKYKLIVQIEKIKKYLEQGKLQEAYGLAEDVDPKKLKSMSDLSVIAECYFQNRRYLEAKELFEQIYDTVKTRRILAQLVHLSIKLNDIIEANYYLEEFMRIAPEDFYQYIFRYSIDKMMKKPLEVLIDDLENLREVEYIESWAYELAKLYFKIGNEAACRKECEKIILWFGNGEYVDRAKALLAYYDGELDVKAIINAAHRKTSVQDKVEIFETPQQEQLEEIDTTENIEVKKAEFSTTKPAESFEIKTSEAEEEGKEEDFSAVMDEKEEQKALESTMGISKHALFHKKYTSMAEELSESMIAEAVSYEEEPNQNSALQDMDDLKEVGVKETGIKKEEIKKADINKTEINKAEENNKGQENDETEESVENIIKTDDSIQKVSLEEDQKIEEFYKIEVKSNHEYIPHLHSSLWPYLEEKEILLEEVFGNFLRLQPFSESIIDSLEKMVHSVYGQQNLVLMGSKDSGQIELAKKYAKLFHKLSLTGSPRVALIDAVKLNHMDLMGKRTQLKDCIMILQNTEELTRDTLIRLMELQQLPRQNIFYILTGQTPGIEQLFCENEELTNAYPIQITIPEYALEDYCGFAYDSFTEAGYKIEKEAFLLVRNEIWEIMKIKRENAFSEVLSYVKQIIQRHEKQKEQLLLDLTRAGALEQFELSVLRIEDIG